jgi:selenide,water dikinase
MGGRPLTALNILGIPTDLVPPRITNLIPAEALRRSKKRSVFGMATHRRIGMPSPAVAVSHRRTVTSDARAGDALILTKPLGTGIITTAIKRGLTNRSLDRKVVAIMTKLNSVGPELAETGLLRAAIDVTGFGLLGHLGALCRASGVGAEIAADAVPVISAEVFQPRGGAA